MDPATAVAVGKAWGSMYDHAKQNENKGNLKIGRWLTNLFKPNLDDPLSSAMNFYTDTAQGQFDAQRYDNYNATQIRVRDALRAGINPSAVIGGSAGHVSPTISAGGDGYKQPSYGFGSMMAGIARDFMYLDKESKELDLESKRLQNDLLRQKLAVATQPGIVSTNGDSPKNSSWRIPMDYRLRNVGDLFLPWKDRSGKIHWFINPEAISDADWSNIEAIRAMAVGADDVSRDYVPRDGSYFKRYWPKFRKWMRSKVGVNY